MNREELFLETIAELSRHAREGASEYEVLMSAALLRKLLLDDEPLADQVNRRPKLTIRYRFNDFPMLELPAPYFWTVQEALDPECLNGPELLVVEGSRDRFLRQPIMYVEPHEITVKDLIKYVAHVHGAVHLGKPKTDKDAILAGIDDRMRSGQYAPGIRSLLSVSRIVLGGLTALSLEVKRGLASAES